MNFSSSLFSLMLKFRRLGLNLPCSSCVHTIPPRGQEKWDFHPFLSSLWVRAGGWQWGRCDRSNGSLSTPTFPAAVRDVPFLCPSVPRQTPWHGGKALRESQERSRNAASASQGHVEGAGATPEMRGEENPAPLERTQRKLAAAQVTGSVLTESRAAPSAPCQGKSLENGMGITQVHTLTALENISSPLLWCFLLLK